jgi:hypothetical protein
MSEKPREDSEVGSLGFALALVYGTGLFTTNVFLSRLGLADFSLIKPRAIFTGAIVLGTLALIASWPSHLLASMLDRNHPPQRPLTKWFLATSAAKLILPVVVVTWMCWLAGKESSISRMLLDTSRDKPPTEFLKSCKLGVELYLLSLVTYALAVQSIHSFKTVKVVNSFLGIASRLAKLTFLLAGALIALGWYISVFAETLYPVVPHAIGGGSPEVVSFIVQNDSVADLKELGIAFIDDKTPLTKPLMVVYESDDFIGVVVRTEEDSVVEERGGTERFHRSIEFNKTLKLDRRTVKGSVVGSRLVSFYED